MPLSENERRDLKGLEQQLRSEDPKLAAALSNRKDGGWLSKLNPLACPGAVVLGGVLLIAGFFTSTTAVALTGVVAVSAGLTALAVRRLGPGHGLWTTVNGLIRKRRTPR